MRPFGKHPRPSFKKNAWRSAEYAERKDTEWDARIDITGEMTVEKIVNTITAARDLFSYVLISDLEFPDDQVPGNIVTGTGSGSKEIHVHIAVIAKEKMTRKEILTCLRGPEKLSDEFCVPRIRTYSYIGWYVHHKKPAWKVNPEKAIAYEKGLLPLDGFSKPECEKVIRMVKKYGDQEDHDRFQPYYDALRGILKRSEE